MKLPPPVLQELRKAMAAKRGARPSRPAGSKHQLDSHRQRISGKRKATLDASTEPAARRPAPEPSPPSWPAPATGEETANCSRQLSPTEGRLAYTAVVAGRAIPQQPSGPLKPTANDSVNSKPAASMDAAHGRKSSNLSSPLSGMPAGTTPPTPKCSATSLWESEATRPWFLFQKSATCVASWPGCGLHAEAVSWPRLRPSA